MTENPEKKIIVDEDWKSQVEREREAARKGPGAEPAQAAAGVARCRVAPGEPDLPGQFALLPGHRCSWGSCLDPVSGKPEKNLPMAKHLIDMLEVLQQKTEGNRTPEESEDIEAMLYQLRMAYVQVCK